MPLKLFDRKRRCMGSGLNQGKEITALSGFGNNVVVGTGRGRILIFNTSSGGTTWENEAALGGLGAEEDSQEPVVQVCCASALGLILLILGDELVGLELEEELRVSNICSDIFRCALNSHPTTDDPFEIQLALCHLHKKQILIGKVISGAEFVRERKVPTQGQVVELAFSGQCLCYATQAGACYVQNLQVRNDSALKLCGDSPQPTMHRAICTFGMEEFALSGIHGLIVFVNGHGISSRPPISLNNETSSIVGLCLREPFLYALDSDGLLSIFSTVDNQLEQSLSFPSDEPFLPQSTYQLANIDGTLLVLPPSGDCLFELVKVPIIAQIEEQVTSGNFDEALEMMNKNFTHFSTSITDEEDILKICEMRRKLAFAFVQKSDFEKGIELLAKCEINPREFLSIVGRQEKGLQLEDTFLEGTWCGNSVDCDGNFPQIPLEFVKRYLEEIIGQQWAQPHVEIIEHSLARLYCLLGEMSELDKLIHSNLKWNDQKFRRWLILERKMANFAAKLAADCECYEEAFKIWEKLLNSEDETEEFSRDEALEDCLKTLFRVKSYSEDFGVALSWLIPLNAKLCMEAIDVLERQNPEGKVPPETVVKLFQAHPQLLFHYLDGRIHNLNSPTLHNKLLELLVFFIKNNDVRSSEEEAENFREKMRNFLLFSEYYSEEMALKLFAGGGHSEKFRIETILAKANDQNAVESLQKLTKDVDSDSSADQEDSLGAAQLLCTRYSSPEMITTMLTLRLRLSRSDPAQRAHIPHILLLLDKCADASEVFRCVPDDLSSSAFLQSFLRRHFAHKLNLAQWQSVRARLALRERTRATHALRRTAASGKFRIDEGALCAHCERRLKAEDEFARNPYNAQLSHLRCHQAAARSDQL